MKTTLYYTLFLLIFTAPAWVTDLYVAHVVRQCHAETLEVLKSQQDERLTAIIHRELVK